MKHRLIIVWCVISASLSAVSQQMLLRLKGHKSDIEDLLYQEQVLSPQEEVQLRELLRQARNDYDPVLDTYMQLIGDYLVDYLSEYDVSSDTYVMIERLARDFGLDLQGVEDKVQRGVAQAAQAGAGSAPSVHAAPQAVAVDEPAQVPSEEQPAASPAARNIEIVTHKRDEEQEKVRVEARKQARLHEARRMGAEAAQRRRSGVEQVQRTIEQDTAAVKAQQEKRLAEAERMGKAAAERRRAEAARKAQEAQQVTREKQAGIELGELFPHSPVLVASDVIVGTKDDDIATVPTVPDDATHAAVVRELEQHQQIIEKERDDAQVQLAQRNITQRYAWMRGAVILFGGVRAAQLVDSFNHDILESEPYLRDTFARVRTLLDIQETDDEVYEQIFYFLLKLFDVTSVDNAVTRLNMSFVTTFLKKAARAFISVDELKDEQTRAKQPEGAHAPEVSPGTSPRSQEHKSVMEQAAAQARKKMAERVLKRQELGHTGVVAVPRFTVDAPDSRDNGQPRGRSDLLSEIMRRAREKQQEEQGRSSEEIDAAVTKLMKAAKVDREEAALAEDLGRMRGLPVQESHEKDDEGDDEWE